MSTLEKAISIATKAHANQKDLAGEEYINHPLRVMEAGEQVWQGLRHALEMRE